MEAEDTDTTQPVFNGSGSNYPRAVINQALVNALNIALQLLGAMIGALLLDIVNRGNGLLQSPPHNA